jgi:hypothetical protein
VSVDALSVDQAPAYLDFARDLLEAMSGVCIALTTLDGVARRQAGRRRGEGREDP